jgi:hypothetical protein
MFSRAERSGLACAALTLTFQLGCGANGDQVLGDLLPGDIIRNDASSPPLDAGACSSSNSSSGREIASNLDIYFVIDRSTSMVDAFGDKWDAFASGFTRFLHSDSTNGVDIGLGYFPASGSQDVCDHCPPRDCGCLAACGCPCDMHGDPRVCPRGPVCDWGSYTRADVEIRPMPLNGGALVMSLAQPLFGGTIIRPALQGALDLATEHAEQNRNDRVAVVLVAGGPPSTNDCSPDTIASCADVAGNSNTTTSVVQFNYQEPSLDPIATRGGGKLYEVDSHRDDVAQRFAQVLDDLRREPHCHYDLPTGNLDWDKINVDITSQTAGGAVTTPLYRVKNRDACSGGLGWYYDRNEHPTRIVACSAACDKIHGTPDTNVIIKFGCPSVPPPPP